MKQRKYELMDDMCENKLHSLKTDLEWLENRKRVSNENDYHWDELNDSIAIVKEDIQMVQEIRDDAEKNRKRKERNIERIINELGVK